MNIPRVVTTLIAVLFLTAAFIQASELDRSIEKSAKDSYVFKTELKNDNITVDSNDGIVTLKGTVENEYHKSLAQEVVASLPGVKKVDNKLEVKPGGPAESSDGWISMKVKAALLFHRNVSARTKVYVKDGVVTLQGEADSQAEKDLTTEYARDVEGVKEVKNKMTVMSNPQSLGEKIEEKIDDASITAQVKFTLLTHRSTSAIRTHVSTQKGIVTVSGNAKNSAEEDLVTKLVSDINGVEKVVNNMIVEK